MKASAKKKALELMRKELIKDNDGTCQVGLKICINRIVRPRIQLNTKTMEYTITLELSA
jgi:hypothetical protein